MKTLYLPIIYLQIGLDCLAIHFGFSFGKSLARLMNAEMNSRKDMMERRLTSEYSGLDRDDVIRKTYLIVNFQENNIVSD